MAQKVGRNSRMESQGGQNAGPGISLGNPGEERRLAATLKKIDKEKRKRETAMSWNQRSFFMKQVFDQDNELRFVKAAQRPKYLNHIPPPPQEGDNSWMKEEYVFSFKTKSSKSPESKDLMQVKLEEGPLEGSSKAIVVDEGASSADLHQQDESKPGGQEAAARVTKESEQAERDKKEEEKRDLASRGVFGARREKKIMPPLMSGAGKQKIDPEVTAEEVVEEKVDDCKITDEPEVNKETTEEADLLNEAKPSSGGTAEAAKPKQKFPVMKVRALGLFAMTFKKTPPVPPLQSQSPPQSQLTNDLKLSSSSNAERDASLLSSSLPPQTAPNMTVKAWSTPSTAPSASEIHRPGSVSLPNSPKTDRKLQLLRQQSEHTIRERSTKSDRLKRALHTSESGHGSSRRGSRRDSTAKSNQERSRQQPQGSGIKAVRSASSTLQKSKREGTAKIHQPSSLPKADSNHIWGVSSENENQDKDVNGNVQSGSDVKDAEDVDFHVIRRIVRTLPAHLMLKTSKREVEAGGDVALLRQKMKDLARADTTRRASLDPRFMKLEKSLCNSP